MSDLDLYCYSFIVIPLLGAQGKKLQTDIRDKRSAQTIRY